MAAANTRETLDRQPPRAIPSARLLSRDTPRQRFRLFVPCFLCPNGLRADSWRPKGALVPDGYRHAITLSIHSADRPAAGVPNATVVSVRRRIASPGGFAPFLRGTCRSRRKTLLWEHFRAGQQPSPSMGRAVCMRWRSFETCAKNPHNFAPVNLILPTPGDSVLRRAEIRCFWRMDDDRSSSPKHSKYSQSGCKYTYIGVSRPVHT